MVPNHSVPTTAVLLVSERFCSFGVPENQGRSQRQGQLPQHLKDFELNAWVTGDRWWGLGSVYVACM